MTPDKFIIEAIIQAIDHHGGKAQFAAAAGIQKAMPGEYLRKWESGTAKEITDAVWDKMWPALRRFLPDQLKYYSRKELSRIPLAAMSRPLAPAMPADMAEIVIMLTESWPSLTVEQRAELRGYIKGMTSVKGKE